MPNVSLSQAPSPPSRTHASAHKGPGGKENIAASQGTWRVRICIAGHLVQNTLVQQNICKFSSKF